MSAPRYFDAHTHLNLSQFSDDRDEVIARSLKAGVWHANVGTQQDTAQLAVDIAEKYEEGVYAIVGLHPVHSFKAYHDEKELGEGSKGFTSRGETFDFDFYKTLAAHKKVVAIGECGLDYYRSDEKTLEQQQEAFVAQIELANELKKPLMLHIRNNPEGGRNAYVDACEILKAHAKVQGDVHFFAGSTEEAQMFLDLGFTISFTGVLTFTPDYDEVVRFVPDDMMLAETDAPFVAPKPHRGKRNEPMYVRHVVERIAEIKGEDTERVRETLLKNTLRLYSLG